MKVFIFLYFIIITVNVYQENEVEAGDHGERAAAADTASGERRPVSTFLNWVCGGMLL